MKLFKALVISVSFFLYSCSFDDKTGIWKNENINVKKENEIFKEFEALTVSDKPFDEIIEPDSSTKILFEKPFRNISWKDIYFDQTNNYKNFKLTNNEEEFFKSKKIIRSEVNRFTLYEEENLILTDLKGNLIVFSISRNKIISKFNFYKKKYKKNKKYLNVIVRKNIIYVADNIGYLYAFDYKKNKIIWAKNYKIPFRSNFKIFKKNLIISNQNNDLFFFDIGTGDKIKLIPTEETTIKNQFKNNLAINKNILFYINTYGTLYAINNETKKVRWFINLNQSLNLNPSSFFSGIEIITYRNKVIVSSNKHTYIIDSESGSIIHKKNFSLKLKPIAFNDYFLSLTNNNLLILVNIKSGEIIYSYKILDEIKKILKIKENSFNLNSFFIANNQIYIFFNNNYIAKLNINGTLTEIIKLPSKLKSFPIIADESILYLNKKNRLIVFN